VLMGVKREGRETDRLLNVEDADTVMNWLREYTLSVCTSYDSSHIDEPTVITRSILHKHTLRKNNLKHVKVLSYAFRTSLKLALCTSLLTFHVNADFMSRTAVFHFRSIFICLFFVSVLCVCLCVWCGYSRLTLISVSLFIESEYK
jgi:hypothetical protein